MPSCDGQLGVHKKAHLLFLEVDEVLVVVEDLDVGEGAPGVLDLLGGDGVLGLLVNLALALEVAAPGPLDLDGRDVVHRKAMVLKEAARQGHLVRRLYEAGAEVPHALLLVASHHVEGRGQELLAKALRRREILHRIGSAVDSVSNLGGQLLALGPQAAEQEVVRRRLAVHLRFPNRLHGATEEEPTDRGLDLRGRQVLSSHRP